MQKTISIIGAGTYGSYLANCIAEKYPDCQIHLFEAGDNTIKSEKQIGFFSKVISGVYRAASSGRFFGLGGTSAKWGGQLLFYSNKDFESAGEMQDIINCNLYYQNKVLGRFFKKVPLLKEEDFSNSLFIKQGIWLKFTKRNIFKHFKLAKFKNIKIHTNARVIRLNAHENKVTKLTIYLEREQKLIEFKTDLYYLTSGAFESLRLMHVSGIVDMESCSLGFSDHVSARCFKLKKPITRIKSHDFQFKFINGSMVTSRIVGEIDNISFYVHPIFNEEFKIFQVLKKIIFKGELNIKLLFTALQQFYSLFPFAYSYFFKKKLYVYGSWYLNVDIELSQSDNQLTLSQECDRYEQRGININYKISKDTINKILLVKNALSKLLKEAGVKFEEIESNVSALKLEDIYHPYGLFNSKSAKSIFEQSNPLSNMYVFNTGLLTRAGGINPTASIFCLIEHHLENELNRVLYFGKQNEFKDNPVKTGTF